MVSVAFSAAGMLSGSGRCHTFDRRADGYCRGEGCAAFLLSRGDSEKVAISGTAVQQDGPSASPTAPNGSSQRRLITTVRDLSDGCALEAHGTGTALGDPIEACLLREGAASMMESCACRWAPPLEPCA